MFDLIPPFSFSFFNQLIVLAINILGIFLAITVILRNSFRDKLTAVFVVMTTLMLVWIDFAYLARLFVVEQTFWSEVFLRIAWVATPPFFAYVYLITVHMLHRARQLAALNFTLLIISLLLSATTAFTDYIIEGVSLTNGDLDIIYGRGFVPFLGIVSLYMVATLIPIFTTKPKPHRRKRINIFLTGIVIFYTANLVFNIALPAFFNITHLYYFGDYSLIFLVGLIAYAIIRYRLMDIRAIIFRAVGFSALAGSFFVLYGLLIYIATSYLSKFNLTSPQYAIMAIVSATLSVPAFHYFQLFLRIITDRFFWQNRINYPAKLISLSKDLSGTINIKDVTDTILKATRDIVRSHHTIIYLRSSTQQDFLPHATAGLNNYHVTLPFDNALILYLEHTRTPIVKDELALRQERPISTTDSDTLAAVINALDWLDASLVLPLFVNKQITGLIILGDKQSGEPYSSRDIDFLAALSPQAAVALENARLYQESLQFAAKLKKEVESATHELAQANSQLKDIDKAKSEFLSIASHQLYTPLTALRGYLSMLKEGDYGRIATKQLPIINILETSTVHLIDLIKNLLDVSRIESGRLELNLKSIDLADIVSEFIDNLMPNAKAKRLKLKFIKPVSSLPHVVADHERLRQVILNFIDNAIKYTNQGEITVSLKADGDEVVFAVTDTGKGMTKDEMAKLFNKFTRVGGASRFHTEGSGLGLYVAKQIVGEHHGKVTVDSPGTNQGSTFSMRLPIEGTSRSLTAGQPASVAIQAT